MRRSSRPPLSEKWLLAFGVIVVAWLIFVVFLGKLPLQVTCSEKECVEAREWIATLLTFFIILGGPHWPGRTESAQVAPDHEVGGG